ncbi:MAG: ATP-dependent RecD-like DNA helicase [Desulfovibrio sp.]|nr:ATP-dependent RecD-like DNA helicase [Desulfovibrio sp.]
MSDNQRRDLFYDEAQEELEGVVEKIVFRNEANGYTVLRIQTEEGGDSIACVGNMVNPAVGAHTLFKGKYVTNPRFGKQFAFVSAEEKLPATEEGIRMYLGSGLIKGIGPEMAARIVGTFGKDTLRILDTDLEKLRKIKGIGKKTLEGIKESWSEARGMRDLLLFLQPHGISAAYAVRIYKAYGNGAVEILNGNPYRMAMDIRGIGFQTADAIAAKLKFPPDHVLRVQAAALYILQKAGDDGHVFLPLDILIQKISEELNVPETLAADALDILERDKRVVREVLAGGEDGQKDYIGVYLARFHHCESKTAFYLRRLLNSPRTVVFKNPEETLARETRDLGLALAPAQVKAVLASTRAKALVITGGPGTGKTTIIKAIIKIFASEKAKILLAAPTGRAAKRMAEATGMDARTIHRLLEYSPRSDSFGRNENNPLPCGLLVVDEASMMDAQLFYHLLKALPLGATLALVGDARQLPSVGPGNVLGDIIDSRVLPVAELNEIFRQSAESEIVCNAHLINNGKMPQMEPSPNRLSEFYFISRENPEEAADLIVDLIKNHIPRRFGLDPINEVQLLTPMRKGAAGSERMNGRLQAALNPNAQEVRRGERVFRLHDKVMQIRNNYDKDIFNGDIGRIVYINAGEKTLSVDFDGVIMPYDFDELDELVPAYAISIHKSQGSEYPAVVIPLLMQHYVLLQRNLVYTGVTRGKKLVVLVGEKKALAMAIKNNRASKRNTWLAQRLALSGPDGL